MGGHLLHKQHCEWHCGRHLPRGPLLSLLDGVLRPFWVHAQNHSGSGFCGHKANDKTYVETFGDTSLEQLPACSYASAEATKLQPMGSVDDTAVLSRNVPLKMALAHWQQAKTPEEKKKYHKEYLTIVRARAADDEAFSRIVKRACRRFEPNSKNLTQCEDRIMNGRSMLTERKWFCHTLLVNTVHETCPKRFPHNAGGWNGYNMKYGNAIVNICENSDDVHDLGSMEMTALKEIVTDECGGPFEQVVV